MSVNIQHSSNEKPDGPLQPDNWFSRTWDIAIMTKDPVNPGFSGTPVERELTLFGALVRAHTKWEAEALGRILKGDRRRRRH